MTLRSFFRHFIGRSKIFIRMESGALLPLLALAMVALTGLVGVAIDLGRLQLVQSKLQFSLDAAALAAGSTISTADLNSEVTKYLNVNFNNYLGSKLTNTVVASNSASTVFNLTATATLPASFLQTIGTKTLTATAQSQITRVLPSLEVAIVIDVSYGDNVPDFKAGLTNFVNKLFSEAAGTIGNLYVGIVPFSHVVNIGTQNAAWINPNSNATILAQHPEGWGPGGSWGGCVDERPNGEDITDDPPTGGSNTLFNEYYWYSDTLNPKFPGTSNSNPAISIANKLGISSGQASPDFYNYPQWTNLDAVQQGAGLNQNTYGLNIWYGTVGTTPGAVPPPSQQYYASPLNSLNQGPNFMCPQPITPLTSDQPTLLNAISNMNIQGDWIPNEGLVWGWRMLSPRWRGLWSGMTGSLPLDYNTPGNNKVIVWVEGIEIDTYGITTALDDHIRSTYGYLSDGVLGTTDWNYANNVLINNKAAAVCAAMQNSGIYVYVVGYSADNSYGGGGFGILNQCATGPNYGFFYGAGNWSGWDNGLDSIADSLVNLRVSH